MYEIDDIADPDSSLNESLNSILKKKTNQMNKNQFKYIDEPIQLIDFSRGFKVNPQAISFLNSITEEIIIVSVVGKARTGKSYLMNLLLDLIGKKNSGFKVASTLQSCTKGIWLWGNYKNSLNGNAKIIFLDSEGTSSTDKSTKTYDSRIFALVVLISSLFLYNTYSNIDEHGISELSLAAHLSNAITTNSDIDKDNLLTELAPNFIWIIRDFTLEKIHPETGEEISSKEYLELCLKNKKCGKNSNDNNLIRQNIIKFFPERDCVTLIRPVDNESDLKKLNEIPFNNLKPGFKLEFKKLKDKIYKEALPKKYNGKKLTGPSLAKLIEEFVKTINSGKIPNINNTWDSVIEKDINDNFQKAINYYKEKINSIKITQSNVYNQSDLLKKLLKFQFDSLEIYDSIIQLNADTFKHNNYKKLFDENKQKLQNQINSTQNKILEQNSTNSNSFCTNTITESFHPMENKLYNNSYKPNVKDEITEDFINLLNDYNEKSKGPKKEKVAFEFILQKEKILIEYINNMMHKENDKNVKKIDNTLKIAQVEMENVKNQKRVVDEKERINKDKIESMENENKKLEEDINDLKDSLDRKNKQLESLKESIKQKKLNQAKIQEEKKRKKKENQKKDNDEKCHCACYLL
jgi:hypothetical protein